MLAASPLRAELSADAPVPVASKKTFVVRVDPRSGKLVQREQQPFRPTPPSKQKQFSALVEQTARTHQLDPLLVDSVIQVESNYNPHAVSSKGAEGLMQLMPSTARMLGVTNAFDPQQNIEAGVRYLKQLKDQFGDDRLALAAYNAGPAAVDKHKWIPPYAETQNYVNEIGRRYENARQAADAVKAPAQRAQKDAAVKEAVPQVAVVEEKAAPVEQFVDPDGRLHLSTKKP